jgi:ribosomal protein S18 acetylase RimI-like enzyme
MAHALHRRLALPSDAQRVVSWFPTRASAILWGGPAVPNPLTAAWLAQCIEAFDTVRYHVWVDASSVVQGVFTLRFQEEGRARFGRFALSPEFRGQGLARDLVEEIISVARSGGAKQLSLGVYGSNQIAKRVYESAGFKIGGERPAEGEDLSGVPLEMKLDL